MKPMPTVSVLMTTFNHERYVREAVESVLGQTHKDLELIVVSDGSTDTTDAILSGLKDPRLIHLQQRRQGPSCAMNAAFARARGKYIAFMSGDDLSAPERLQAQIRAYEARPGARALFSHVRFIGETGTELTGRHFGLGLFNFPRMSQAESLRRLFFQGNFLSAISFFTEKSVLDQEVKECPRHPGQLMHPALLQLQDYDLWARLIRRVPFEMIEEPLVSYRIRERGANLSAPHPTGHQRFQNEMFIVLKDFFRGMPDGLFAEAFAPELGGETDRLRGRVKIYLSSKLPQARLLGLSLAAESISNDPSGLDPLAFFELSGKYPIFYRKSRTVLQLLKRALERALGRP